MVEYALVSLPSLRQEPIHIHFGVDYVRLSRKSRGCTDNVLYIFSFNDIDSTETGVSGNI